MSLNWEVIPILNFLVGVVVGVLFSIGVYALITANDDDVSKGHPL